MFQIVNCTYDEHAAAILAILNDAILHTTALYDYQPRSMDSMDNWFREKTGGEFPVIGAVDEGDELMGFATYGTFRNWAAYKYSVEHSVYVDAAHRGKRVGRQLMECLISRAREQQYHVMIGAIDSANIDSIAFHQRLGFRHAGTLSEVGFKFGRWLDLEFHQLVL